MWKEEKKKRLLILWAQTWKIWTYKVREGPRDSRRISSCRVLYRYWTSFRDFSSNSWNTAFDKRLQLFFRALYPTEVRHWLIFKPFNNRVQNLYINRSHFFFMPWKKKWLQFNHTIFVRCPGTVVKYFYL